MKTAIVNFSDLGTGCWSARRFCGECSECEQVSRCKHEEGVAGRKEKIRRLIAKKEASIKALKKRLEEM